MTARRFCTLAASGLALAFASGCSGTSSTQGFGELDSGGGSQGEPSGSSGGAAAGSSSGSGSSGAGSSSGAAGSSSGSGGGSGADSGLGDARASSGSSGGAGGSDASAPGADSGAPDAAASTCPAPPATESAQAIKAVNDVNAARTLAGVPCAALIPALDTSAQKHCAYYAANANSTTCTSNAHVEVSGCTGFVAANFNTRETMAGYTGRASYEVMAFTGNPDQAVQTWINSVWHRIPMLSPWIRDMGYGGTTTPAACDTIDFGVGATTPNAATAVYPYGGQTGVPTSFDGSREGPTPPAPPAGWPSGFPVILYLRGGTVQSHQIAVDGTTAPLAHVWIDSTNTTNSPDDFILYTNTPLTANTTYHVQIAATQGTAALSFDWKFTTGAR